MHILNIGTSVASQLLEGTSSTARVQQMVQLSLTPVFLLAAIGAFLNVINQRLTWLVERIHALEGMFHVPPRVDELDELPALRLRRRYAHLAINLSTGAGLLICTVVGLTFVSAFVRPALGNLVALSWVAAMMAVFGALLSFLVETRVASRSMRNKNSHSSANDRLVEAARSAASGPGATGTWPPNHADGLVVTPAAAFRSGQNIPADQ